MRTFLHSVESKWLSPYTTDGVSGNAGWNTIWCVVDLLDPYVVYPSLANVLPLTTTNYHNDASYHWNIIILRQFTTTMLIFRYFTATRHLWTLLLHFACLFCHSVWDSIGIFEWKRICVCFYRLLIYILMLEIQLSRRESKRFNPTKLCSYPKPGPGSATLHFVVLVLCTVS